MREHRQKFPDEWRQSAVALEISGPLWPKDPGIATKGLIRLPSGMVEYYTQDRGIVHRDMPAYSCLTVIVGGEVLERRWDRKYSVAFLVTLAKRWAADRWTSGDPV